MSNDSNKQPKYRAHVPPCPGGTLYTIRAGDTLFTLAGRFNTTVDAIMMANPGLDPMNLQVGRVICIPTAPQPGQCPGGFHYQIVAGDTFFNLARRFNTTVEALMAANPGVDPNRLMIGQVICIPVTPTPPCPGGTYQIRPGDTFFNIAMRFNTTVEALMAANPGVDPNRLMIGQVICLPPGTPGPIPCPGGTIYRVQQGDSLYLIGLRFGIPLDRLIAANPQLQDPSRLTIGQPICIPPRM
ncbi:MAG TPA: LysM peptidoglycan-binding domain-containing protein [Clostridia bacterium]|nr:LysM peptidoglycan-binding domain-containing protein [Clostridia bacterium]